MRNQPREQTQQRTIFFSSQRDISHILTSFAAYYGVQVRRLRGPLPRAAHPAHGLRARRGNRPDFVSVRFPRSSCEVVSADPPGRVFGSEKKAVQRVHGISFPQAKLLKVRVSRRVSVAHCFVGVAGNARGGCEERPPVRPIRVLSPKRLRRERQIWRRADSRLAYSF